MMLALNFTASLQAFVFKTTSSAKWFGYYKSGNANYIKLF